MNFWIIIKFVNEKKCVSHRIDTMMGKVAFSTTGRDNGCYITEKKLLLFQIFAIILNYANCCGMWKGFARWHVSDQMAGNGSTDLVHMVHRSTGDMTRPGAYGAPLNRWSDPTPYFLPDLT